MKRILLLLAVIIPLACQAKKLKNLRLVLESPVQSEIAAFTSDSITFEFDWDRFRNFGITMSISNNTKGRVYIEWNNMRIDDERIAFGSDNMLSYQNDKADEVIHSGSRCVRFVAPWGQFSNRYRQMFYIKGIKKFNESGIRTLIVPIRFDKDVVDYRFEIKVVADKD